MIYNYIICKKFLSDKTLLRKFDTNNFLMRIHIKHHIGLLDHTIHFHIIEI